MLSQLDRDSAVCYWATRTMPTNDLMRLSVRQNSTKFLMISCSKVIIAIITLVAPFTSIN